MQFGIREICDVVFKAKNAGSLGSFDYVAGQPVLYIDSAKTSTMEGAATTVYAQGGKGNARLIAWEGERTLTFTIEDALLSELGFAILSGAGLLNNTENGEKIYVHTSSVAVMDKEGVIDLTDVLNENETVHNAAPVFVMSMKNGSFTGVVQDVTVGETDVQASTTVSAKKAGQYLTATGTGKQEQVFVDFYIEKTSGVTEMTIDVENFAGYYYVEASTLFRRQSDGKDLPAELIFPNVKIQSNFTFNMAATGDPSTFTFTMDAMPGYTRFDRKKKVLCAMQVVDEAEGSGKKYGDSTKTIADANELYPTTDVNEYPWTGEIVTEEDGE